MDVSEHSIIIPFHKNKELMYHSLATLEKTIPSGIEVIIVANNSNDNELNLKVNEKKYKLIKIKENLFYPKAINLGVSASKGKYITFCDPDIIYIDNWFQDLYNGFKSKNSIGAASSKLLNPLDDRILDFGILFSKFNSGHTAMGLKFNHPLASYDREVQCACSAIMMTTKDLFCSVNGIDEDMPYAYCDLDFCFKLKAKGFSTWVIANSMVYHKGSTSDDNSKTNFSYLNADSKGAFYAKNFKDITYDLKNWFSITSDFFLKKNTICSKFILVDLSSMYQKEWYYEIIQQNLGINFYDKYEFHVSKRNQSYINLYDTVSPNLIDLKTPLLYFTDVFTSLKNNNLWCKIRDISNDLIIDKNGNFVSFKELLSGEV